LFLGCFIIQNLGVFDLVKSYRSGRAKLYGETQTLKPIVKGLEGPKLGNGLALKADLLRKLAVRLTKLILTERYYRPSYWTKVLFKTSVCVYPLACNIISTAIEYIRIMLTTQSGIDYLIIKCKQRPYSVPKTGTTGSPKATRLGCYGDGVTIVPYTSRSIMGRVTGSSSTIRQLSTKAGRNPTRRGSVKEEVVKQDTNLLTIKAVSNMLNLVSAYETIKSRPGNMTPGVDQITLDGMDLQYLRNIQKKLISGTFKFNPARRIFIPKPGSTNKRPLAIASPREKIVQQAIANVLIPTYEKIFLDSSHGFRPGKSTHTAILAEEAKFDSVKYIIEADFSKAFDSIRHDKLMEVLSKKISDQKLLKLIKSGLQAGYIDEFGKLSKNYTEGTPQGSVLSPILCNIFLHQLDENKEK
jgi:retron-type reverse transcriptase